MPAAKLPQGAKLLVAADLAFVLAQLFGHAVDRQRQVADFIVAGETATG